MWWCEGSTRRRRWRWERMKSGGSAGKWWWEVKDGRIYFCRHFNCVYSSSPIRTLLHQPFISFIHPLDLLPLLSSIFCIKKLLHNFSIIPLALKKRWRERWSWGSVTTGWNPFWNVNKYLLDVEPAAAAENWFHMHEMKKKITLKFH